jgi:hypothetical protein
MQVTCPRCTSPPDESHESHQHEQGGHTLIDADDLIARTEPHLAPLVIANEFEAEALEAHEDTIGIGAPSLSRGSPSHTTRHAGPHRAVRRVEVTG